MSGKQKFKRASTFRVSFGLSILKTRPAFSSGPRVPCLPEKQFIPDPVSLKLSSNIYTFASKEKKKKKKKEKKKKRAIISRTIITFNANNIQLFLGVI